MLMYDGLYVWQAADVGARGDDVAIFTVAAGSRGCGRRRRV